MNLASVESTNRLTKEGIYKKDSHCQLGKFLCKRQYYLANHHGCREVDIDDYDEDHKGLSYQGVRHLLVINNFNEGDINYLVVDSVLRSSTKPIRSCIEINLDEKVTYIFHFLIISTASWCLCLISLTGSSTFPPSNSLTFIMIGLKFHHQIKTYPPIRGL